LAEVVVVIGAGSIGQAIARRIGSGKRILLGDLHEENARTSATVLANAGFDVETAKVDIS
jgi:saccharopine dehydrogenase-like NADP-dependent oxidoreductase